MNSVHLVRVWRSGKDIRRGESRGREGENKTQVGQHWALRNTSSMCSPVSENHNLASLGVQENWRLSERMTCTEEEPA